MHRKGKKLTNETNLSIAPGTNMGHHGLGSRVALRRASARPGLFRVCGYIYTHTHTYICHSPRVSAQRVRCGQPAETSW